MMKHNNGENGQSEPLEPKPGEQQKLKNVNMTIKLNPTRNEG
jgi:hypothetical protein